MRYPNEEPFRSEPRIPVQSDPARPHANLVESDGKGVQGACPAAEAGSCEPAAFREVHSCIAAAGAYLGAGSQTVPPRGAGTGCPLRALSHVRAASASEVPCRWTLRVPWRVGLPGRKPDEAQPIRTAQPSPASSCVRQCGSPLVRACGMHILLLPQFLH